MYQFELFRLHLAFLWFVTLLVGEKVLKPKQQNLQGASFLGLFHQSLHSRQQHREDAALQEFCDRTYNHMNSDNAHPRGKKRQIHTG